MGVNLGPMPRVDPWMIAPHGAVTSADDRTAIVACYGSDEIAVVDLTSPTLQTSRYPLGAAQGVVDDGGW